MILNYRLISSVVYISRCNSCCEHQELQYFSNINSYRFLLLFKFMIQFEEQALLFCYEVLNIIKSVTFRG
jgi:hypothetical protein